MIIYEFPSNERIRILLRIEDLYQRLTHFVEQKEPWQHHAALIVLFELMEVATRGELKSDLLQELDKKATHLDALRHNPDISESILQNTLDNIHQTQKQLLATSGKFGQHLRENEWLMLIKQRLTIPGGTCEFDLPHYHHWLSQPPEYRMKNFEQWLAPLVGIYSAIHILLKMLRSSYYAEDYIATQGNFQLLQPKRTAQILQLELDPAFNCYPELSANKFAINIRFVQTQFSGKGKPKQVSDTIPFQLRYCN